MQNNPLRWTDPTGHSVSYTRSEAFGLSQTLRAVADLFTGGTGLTAILTTKGAEVLRLQVSAIVTAAISSGLISSAIGALIATLAAPALIPATGFLLWATSTRLTELADMIDEFNTTNGVTISNDCSGFYCETVIVSNDTGNGTMHQMPITVAGVLFGDPAYHRTEGIQHLPNVSN